MPKHQEKEREREREIGKVEKGHVGSKIDETAQAARSALGGEIHQSLSLWNSPITTTKYKKLDHHHHLKPTTHFHQQPITICIKLSDDHHGRKKKNLKTRLKKEARVDLSKRRKRRWVWLYGFHRWWVWLCGFGCWFCLMWLMRFSGDWVC